ncbi:MAG: hypothetical protein JWM88_1084 [Verrucomicrobia bacterium]|nr:hypothetical protein [Verrucomicrobiota bacterium]
MSAAKENPASGLGVPSHLIAGVRYSLPDMLAELKVERAAAAFAMEKLEQSEIQKLFKAPRRAKLKK